MMSANSGYAGKRWNDREIWVMGNGQGGIRTLETALTVYTLSRLIEGKSPTVKCERCSPLRQHASFVFSAVAPPKTTRPRNQPRNRESVEVGVSHFPGDAPSFHVKTSRLAGALQLPLGEAHSRPLSPTVRHCLPSGRPSVAQSEGAGVPRSSPQTEEGT